jgi:very-short-patch-repair endonuclease
MNKTTDEFIKDSKRIHGDKYDYSKTVYKHNKDKVIIICKKHGEFLQKPNAHLSARQGCPYCHESHGETKVRKFLENNKILFTPQKRFKDCKYKLPLPFDFYLNDLNICIEYDGEQHSRQLNLYKNEENYEIRKIKDKIKTNYCLNNNILLIRIRYNENIENVLKEKLIDKFDY